MLVAPVPMRTKVDPTDAITLPIPINVPTPILQLVPVLRRLRRLNTLLVFSR